MKPKPDPSPKKSGPPTSISYYRFFNTGPAVDLFALVGEATPDQQVLVLPFNFLIRGSSGLYLFF
jgi:hypothetical protein